MTWQYHIETVPYHTHFQKSEATKSLNNFGEEGWELVTAHLKEEAGTLTLFFKRQHPPSPPVSKRIPEPSRKTPPAIVSVKKSRQQ